MCQLCGLVKSGQFAGLEVTRQRGLEALETFHSRVWWLIGRGVTSAGAIDWKIIVWSFHMLGLPHSVETSYTEPHGSPSVPESKEDTTVPFKLNLRSHASLLLHILLV